MKKIFSVVAALLLTVTAAFAQTTVMGSRTFENMYVGVTGGVLAPIVSDGSTFNHMPLAGIEVGKNFTPTVGIGVEVLGTYANVATPFYTIGVVVNPKLNLSNWIGGYKGQPRLVEVSLVPGIGYANDIVNKDENGNRSGAVDKQYVTGNPAAQIDFNLGKQKAWQINIKSGYVWRTKLGVDSPKRDMSAVNLRIGVSYKFGSKSKKSHNFVVCPYTVTKADYDVALARIAELEGRKPEKVEVIKEIPVEKLVEKTVNKNTSYLTIPFSIGRYELTKAEKAFITAYAKNINVDSVVLVTGSADLGTGSRAINEKIAANRAENVAKVLRENGITNVTTVTAFDTNDVAEASRTAVIYIQ